MEGESPFSPLDVTSLYGISALTSGQHAPATPSEHSMPVDIRLANLERQIACLEENYAQAIQDRDAAREAFQEVQDRLPDLIKGVRQEADQALAAMRSTMMDPGSLLTQVKIVMGEMWLENMLVASVLQSKQPSVRVVYNNDKSVGYNITVTRFSVLDPISHDDWERVY